MTATVSDRWKYEHHGGTRYPVGYGQVWQVGPHLFACADLTTQFDQFRRRWEKQPAMIYSDPPWNDSNVSSFYTKAGRAKGPKHASILRKIMEIAASLRLPAYLEGSVHRTLTEDTLVDETGGRIQQVFKVTYYKRNPSLLYQVTWGPEWSAPEALHGADDADTPLIVLAHAVRQGYLQPGDVVLDPCLGVEGLTARAAQQCGLVCYGTELSPYRLSASMSALADLSDYTPIKVGDLV